MLKIHLSRYVLPLLLLLSGWAQAATSYSQIYIFGDSLSDTGNLASVTQAFPAPYFNNRVSNGPVAVETLAAKLGHSAAASLHLIGPEVGSNYAVAGANATGTDPIDLATQILMFHANHNNGAPDDALYIIFIGGNDVRAARDTASWDDAKAIILTAASDVGLAIASLSQAGARSFLLINAPDVAQIPETQLLATASQDSGLVKRTAKLSRLYRKSLHQLVQQLENSSVENSSVEYNSAENNSGINITEFDLLKFFSKLIKHADQYGFTNTTDACFSSVSFSFHVDCDSGLNFDQFIFFDEIHPTAKTHALAGEAIYRALQKHKD